MKSTQNLLFLKNTKKGFIKKVNFQYLRSDVPCGIVNCTLCDNSDIQNKLTFEKEIKIIDGDIVLTNIDAIEVFDIFENCLIYSSEYLYIKENNIDIFNRLVKIIENKTIYIFPNIFSKNCALIDINNQTKEERRKNLFVNTSNYLLSHIKNENYINEDIFLFLTHNIDYKLSIPFAKLIKLEELCNYTTTEESNNFYNYISYKDFYEKDIFENENNLYNEYYNELYNKIKNGELFRGIFQFINKNEGIIKSSLLKKDFQIENKNINRALHGDLVCFEILPLNYKNKRIKENSVNNDLEDFEENDNDQDLNQNINLKEEILSKINQNDYILNAKVVGILKRNKENFCGTIISDDDYNCFDKILITDEEKIAYENVKNKNKEMCLFIPTDEKYPFFLMKLKNKQNYNNKRIILKLDNWSIKSYFPIGHFIKLIGEVNDIKVENEVLLYEYNINLNPYSKKIISCLPDENTELKIDENEIKYRRDLRNICICSIDPPGCKDIDDALHARILQNGNIEVGVHIADVTHYIKQESEIDKIASKICNTVYLVHKRTDMLPKVLTENLCSLVTKDRYAFSVIWEFNSSYEIVKVDYFKSIIKSSASLTYEQANTIMNDKSNKSDLASSIRYLNNIAKFLKNKRLDDGALILASNEMKFNVDFETNSINDIRTYPTFETNSLVEEFMLLANVYVAEKIYQCYPSCTVLRRHPKPKFDQLEILNNIFATNNLSLEYQTSKKLSDSLDKIKNQNIKNPFLNKLIRIMITRTMNQAKYINSSEYDFSDYEHYGLAMPIYTHFTSPIRRYCDVIVHRLLAACLDIESLPFILTSKDKLNKLCDNMNKQNRKAFFCSRESNTYSVYLYFLKYNMKEMEIVITNIDSKYISGISKEHGIETIVDFSEIGIKEINNELKYIILNSSRKIKIFDTIKVRIFVNMINYRRSIKFLYCEKE